MTCTIVSRRSLVLVAMCKLLLLAKLSSGLHQSPLSDSTHVHDNNNNNNLVKLSTSPELVADERHHLDDDQLSSIIKDFGGQLKDTMEDEMEKLFREVESQSSAGQAHHSRPRRVISEAEMDRLRAANRAAGGDIQTRIELTGDNKGALPQGRLSDMASSFVAATSGRLTLAGAYVGSKISSLTNEIHAKIPARLKRFFRWPNFLNFKIRFHKTYRSMREELYRHMVFLRSHIVVSMQHLRFLLGRDKHLTGQNQFSDWTEKEFTEREGNHDAERSASDLDSGALTELDAPTKRRLAELAKSGKDVLGKRVITSETNRWKRHQKDESEPAELDNKRQRRVRRATNSDKNADEPMRVNEFDYMDDDDDELQYNEDDDEELHYSDDEDDFGNILDETAPSVEDSMELSQLVDQFASELDLSELEDIEDNLDDALNASNQFKPIDLRDTGCIGKAENQNGCGCCYSHAAHGAASYYNCRERGQDKPDRYHARFPADCGRYMTPEGRYPKINSCRGGQVSKVHAFISQVGVQRFAHYNIARVSANLEDPTACVYPRPQNLSNHGWNAVIEQVPMFQRSYFVLLKLDEVDLHLRTVGPVVVNVREWKDFKSYQSGIVAAMDEKDSCSLHSMLIVGHDIDAKGRDYWIILNSFGIAWGEYGFLRVYREALDDFAVIYGGLSPLDT